MKGIDLKEKVKNKNYIYNGKILNLRCDDAILPDGRDCKREVVEHSGGACILPINENNEIYFVEQYRYPYDELVLEIPAGKLNEGENHLTTAIRELQEETGIKAEKLEYKGEIYPSPGYTNEKIHLYFAKNLKKGKLKLDEDEFLNVKKVSIEKVKIMIQKNQIKDAKTLIAVLKYLTEL